MKTKHSIYLELSQTDLHSHSIVKNCFLILIMSMFLAGCQVIKPNSNVNTGEASSLGLRSNAEIKREEPSSEKSLINVDKNNSSIKWLTKEPNSPPDLWRRLRVGFAMQALGGQSERLQQQHERWYRDRPEHMQRVFTRARLYMYDIVQAVEESGLPLEVALLPAVESAFQPAAHSSASADGLWQFIAPTGRRYDLKQHLFLDERRNPRAATRAAIRYLQYLRTRYNGDMQLALAAYNCGEGCIDAHVRRARAKGLQGRFEDLEINQETANYVPRLLALSKLVAEAVDTGALSAFGLPTLNNMAYFVAIPVERDLDISLAAKFAGMHIGEFKALNPQHKKPLIVAATGQDILIPIELARTYTEALSKHIGPMTSWTAMRVKKPITPANLAHAHGADVKTLMAINGISPGRIINSNSTVLVPRRSSEIDIPQPLIDAAFLSTSAEMIFQQLRLNKGEGWKTIVKKLNGQGILVTLTEIQSWNPNLKLKQGLISFRIPSVKVLS